MKMEKKYGIPEDGKFNPAIGITKAYAKRAVVGKRYAIYTHNRKRSYMVKVYAIGQDKIDALYPAFKDSEFRVSVVPSVDQLIAVGLIFFVVVFILKVVL
jgi:ABC-type iron transport system FetAB permease component